jgi:hypothetical protein
MDPNQIQSSENEVVFRDRLEPEYADVPTMGNNLAYKWQHK